MWRAPEFLSHLVLFAAVALAGSEAAARDAPRPSVAKTANDKAFQKIKRDVQQKFHSKKPEERIAALERLAEVPCGDAADLVYVTLLDDRSDDVREAAVELLKGWRDREDVAARLLSRMISETRKDSMDIRAIGGLRALAGTENDGNQVQVLKYLDEFLGTPRANPHLLHEMIDAQAAHGEAEEVLRMLTLFTRAQYFDRNFGFRRCVVQGITQQKIDGAITHLINLLSRITGQVQYDAVSHLIAATGQDFADDAVKWKVWWAQNQGFARAPDKSRIAPVGNYGKFGDYYGIPICAKRVVFVLDTSGSMRGAKLEAAKVELTRAIRSLPKEVSFSLVIFNSSVRIWQRELVPADESMKQIAVNVVLDQEARSNTASYDALEAAFDLDPEAIYFLSDGAPRGGKIEDPGQIISTIAEINRVRRISIHAIGLDTDVGPSTAPFARFMKALAETNWGEYRAVH